MKTHFGHLSTDVRRSSTASSENSPSIAPTSSLEKEKKSEKFKKLKTISSTGEWIVPEKRHFHEDLNVIFSEDPKKFLGVFHTDFYYIIRKYIKSVHRKGIELYYTKIEPNHTIKGQIAIIHGFGEHSGRYLTFGDFFAKRGFLVHLIDLSGFGYSGGPKCCSSLDELHEDIETLLLQCENYSHLPLFLMGQGFGAGIILSFLLRNQIKVAGVITTAALIETHQSNNYNFLVKMILGELATYYGDFCFNAKMNPTSLCKNNYNIRKFLHDPLLTPLISLKMLKCINDILGYVMPNAHKFNYPILIIHGLKDTITNPNDSLKFYERISSRDKNLKLYEDGFHQLHDDNEFMNLQKHVHKWCKTRCKKNLAYSGIKNIRIKYGVNNEKSIKKMFFVCIILLFLWMLK